MLAKKDFCGVWTAIVTPFKEDGSIDWSAYEKIIAYQINAGIKGLVIAGTTGEGSTLRVQEKLSLIKKAFALCKNSDVQIMAGCGSSDTSQVVEFAGLALKAGADSLLVVTPPYNKPNMTGLYKHYDLIAKTHKAPICLYHVPSRTAQTLSLESFKRLCEISEITCIKEASADLSLFSSLVQECSKQNILSGDDPTFLPSLAVGGMGSISVLSNIFPKEFVILQESFQKGKVEEAKNIHKALFEMIQILFCETNPCPVKAALAHMGLCENHLRLPLASVSEENLIRIKDIFHKTQHKLEKACLS